MLYFLITYGGTLLAILTAAGGAMFGFLKFGGTAAVEQWLKRNYKAWELYAEKPFKEDFLRLETQIKAIAAKEQTKFELAHPDRVSAAKELYKLCTELHRKVSELYIIKSFVANGKNQGFAEMLKDSNASILTAISAPYQFIAEHNYNLDKSLTALVDDFISDVATLVGNENQTDMKEFSKVNDIMKTKLGTISNAIKQLLGS